jgi:LPS export ABC transporter protein LptC
MPSVNTTGKFFLLRGILSSRPLLPRPFLLFGLLAMGLLFASCGNKQKDLPSNGQHTIIPEEVEKVEIFMSEGNNTAGNLQAKIKGKLTSPFMLQYQRADTPYTEFPRTLHVDFYKDSIKIGEMPVIESQIDALYGKYFTNQDKVFLRDSVVVKNVLKGDTVHCRELWWDKQTQKLYTDKPVRIYTKDKILFGTGMEADQNFRWWNIKKMTGTILTSDNAVPK